MGTVDLGLCEPFQDFWNKLCLILSSCVIKKTCAFVVMRIGKKVVWAGGRMGRGH